MKDNSESYNIYKTVLEYLYMFSSKPLDLLITLITPQFEPFYDPEYSQV